MYKSIIVIIADGLGESGFIVDLVDFARWLPSREKVKAKSLRVVLQ